jgi:integrase
MMFRHGLRVNEALDLKWTDIDWATAPVHIKRLKQGSPSAQPIDGKEMRLLRKVEGSHSEERLAFLTRQASLVAIANYRVEPQPKQRRQIEETGTSMAISISNWNGKGGRANPHTRKIAPATITAMRLISSFVLRAIAKVPNPTASKTNPAICIFIIQYVVFSRNYIFSWF